MTMPDLTTLPKLQIDGVPEQLADWEAEQKKKRAEDLKSGGSKQQAAKTSNWEGVKKDAQRGAVAGAAVAALGGDKA